MMGYEIIRYIAYLKPKVIGIENVPEFKKWAPLSKEGQPDKTRTGEEFEKWKKTICDLGYTYTESIRNAADDGMPTRRVRYFAFFVSTILDVDIEWPEYSHNKKGDAGMAKWVPCRNFLDLDNEG